jgi:RNA polymerase sigma factor for flagellar operon FliA
MTGTVDPVLVRDNLPLVRALARRMAPSARPFLEMGDLVSIGTEALLVASRRFDRSRNVAFGSFAYRRVRGAMVEGLGVAGPHTRGRRRRRAGRPEPRPLPLLCEYDDRRHATAGRRELATVLAERIDDGRLAGRLDDALATLDARERELVRRHYFDGEPVQDIARDLGISRAWASRLHARALARLRDQLAPEQTRRARPAARR